MEKRSADVVIVRMDKIGDLVVTFPIDEHPVFAGRKVTWFITKGLAFVAEQSAPRRAAMEFKRRFSMREFFRMYFWLRKNSPRAVVFLHSPWWASMAAWLADVPERIGRMSQWHSFLFLNVGIRQSRKTSDRHESDFNFDLVEAAHLRLGFRRTPSLPALKKSFLRLLAPNPFGTLSHRGLTSQGYRIVHPGMAGSSLNWPAENFRRLCEALSKEGPVLITGTKADQKYLAQLQGLRDQNNIVWMVDQLKPYELLDLLSQARSVVAPSTGVVHLSASLGTPTLGIYSPRTLEHPRRWGPKGFKVSVVCPDATGENFKSDVMEKVTVEHVIATLKALEQGEVASEVVTAPTA